MDTTQQEPFLAREALPSALLPPELRSAQHLSKLIESADAHATKNRFLFSTTKTRMHVIFTRDYLFQTQTNGWARRKTEDHLVCPKANSTQFYKFYRARALDFKKLQLQETLRVRATENEAAI